MLKVFRSISIQIDFRFFRTVMIIMSILGFSVFSGLRIESRLPIFLGLGVCILIGIIILLRHQMLGLLLLIPVSTFLRFELGTGTNVSLNGTVLLVLGLLGLWLVRKMIQERDMRLIPSAINLPAILLVITSLVSIVMGNSGLVLHAQETASLPAQFGGWLLLVLPIGVLLLSSNVLTELPWVKATTYAFIIIGSIYFIFVQFEFTRNVINNIYYAKSIGPTFRIWLVALSMGQALYNQKLSSSLRIFLIFSALLVLRFGLINYDWVVGWSTPLIALWVLIWLRSWRWGLALTLTGLAFFIVKSNDLISQVWDPTQQYSTVSRMWTWPIMWDLIKINPISGLGPANYYYYTSLYPISGWYVKFNSHNNYIDIVAQYGFLGMLIFVWLIAAISRLGWQLRSLVNDDFSKGYVNASLAGIVATLVSGVMGDWFVPFLYNIGIPGFRSAVFVWLFIGGMIAIDNIHRKQMKHQIAR
jgi:O-antigen ligase